MEAGAPGGLARAAQRSPALHSHALGHVCEARMPAACPHDAPLEPLRTSAFLSRKRARSGRRQARRAGPARLAEHQVLVGRYEQVALQAARDARREGVAQRDAARAPGRGRSRRVARPPGGRARARSRARPTAVARLRGARRRDCARVWRARAAAGQRGVHEQVVRQQNSQASGIDGHLAHERRAGEHRAAAAGQVLDDHAGQRVPARAAARRA
jgi:hypothetical protein